MTPLFVWKLLNWVSHGNIKTVTSKNDLTLKAPNKNCSRRHFKFLLFILQRKKGLIFHVNPLPSRGFTWNIKSYFLWKTMKKCSRQSSAAVVTGALSLKQTVSSFPCLRYAGLPFWTLQVGCAKLLVFSLNPFELSKMDLLLPLTNKAWFFHVNPLSSREFT